MRELNCINDICPLPVIKAKKALEGIAGGGLCVMVDNGIAAQNLTKLAGEKGFKCEVIKDSQKCYRVIFYKNDNNSHINVENADTDQMAGELSNFKKKDKGHALPLVVVISSDKMGDGDGGLGRALIKGFIYALSECSETPSVVIFYNSGAHLSALGSESLEDLKKLEKRGCKVLTCGACIDYYGYEKPGVGDVTNMYEIAEKLMNAGKIIRP